MCCEQITNERKDEKAEQKHTSLSASWPSASHFGSYAFQLWWIIPHTVSQNKIFLHVASVIYFITAKRRVIHMEKLGEELKPQQKDEFKQSGLYACVEI